MPSQRNSVSYRLRVMFQWGWMFVFALYIGVYGITQSLHSVRAEAGDIAVRTTASNTAASDSSINLSGVDSSGGNTALAYLVTYRSNSEVVNDITFDSQSATYGCRTNNNEYTSEVWYIQEAHSAASGTSTITFTSGVEDIVAGVAVVENVDTTQEPSAACDNAWSSAPSVAVPSSNTSLVLGGVIIYTSETVVTDPSGSTSLWSLSTANNLTQAVSLPGQASSTSLDWSSSQSWPWAAAAVSFEQASVGSASPSPSPSPTSPPGTVDNPIAVPLYGDQYSIAQDSDDGTNVYFSATNFAATGTCKVVVVPIAYGGVTDYTIADYGTDSTYSTMQSSGQEIIFNVNNTTETHYFQVSTTITDGSDGKFALGYTSDCAGGTDSPLVVNSTSVLQTTDQASTTISYEVSSSGNNALVVFAGYNDGDPWSQTTNQLSSVTYNGQAFQKVCKGAQNDYGFEIWYLLQPASGTYDVVTTAQNPLASSSFYVVELDNVDQDTPVVDSACGGGGGTTASVFTSAFGPVRSL